MFAFSPPVLKIFSSFGGLKKIKKVHFSQGLKGYSGVNLIHGLTHRETV